LGGEMAGRTTFLPQIIFKSKECELPFDFRRRQFPVQLAFCMTINKSQGQSVKHVGIDLQNPVFTHGQLYVALSRCISSHRIKVLLSEKMMGKFKALNIVFSEVLLTT
jgi:ATP-dependent DNA helicase PIF1